MPDACLTYADVCLLDGAGAVGLDLSFVSHIFLLDPIWDKSLEDQVARQYLYFVPPPAPVFVLLY